MNVSLTEKQRKYIDDQVKSGDYQNASEVVRDALRKHELNEEKLQYLRKEIQKGIDSGISSRNVQDILKAKRKEHGLE
ncbi:type II toxin-antitoxin system ParD family antitoxin [Aequorivita xiaoshiensis]|uniref:Type II toxin-antitoxin system ParD family antitoxin n=1 Tax=Aequorivita xiaoshiensis TaxID=2874476 RepID=A0A9X1QWS4_9FLAO|nr:type II toxin-antitoxin system ParD family antitoxin [Aequorivita xiaoshiensis]MCG2429921.1 type II toxin-antitoxin system ParD family antitoxin [Aequorivita xiaoshiensis]